MLIYYSSNNYVIYSITLVNRIIPFKRLLIRIIVYFNKNFENRGSQHTKLVRKEEHFAKASTSGKE